MKRKLAWSVVVLLVWGLGIELVRRWQHPFDERDFSPIGLLTYEDVQRELNLSNDQISKISQLAEQFHKVYGESLTSGVSRERRKQASDAVGKGIRDILEPEQLKRCFQLKLQQSGPAVFLNPLVEMKLELTEAQKNRLEGIFKKSSDERWALFRDLQSRQYRRAMKTLTQLNDRDMGEMMTVLNEPQKDMLKEVLGKPFHGKLPPGGFFP